MNNEISLIAENHSKRSEFIYKIFKSSNNVVLNKIEKIPKVIIQFWHDGDNIPKDVYDCIKSWEILKKKGFTFKLFDDKSARKFIQENFEPKFLKAYLKCHHPAMRCDYFRLCYIYLNGGFYLDCDEFYLNENIDLLFKDDLIKMQPLCYNLENDEMVKPDDYFYKDFDSNYIYYFNNNPIIAPPKHKLILIALTRSTERLISNNDIFDIQSTTGPGNFTVATVIYLSDVQNQISIMKNWEKISETPWNLNYRKDDRNWRLYNGKNNNWFR